jgi:hypothetical protein
VTLFSASLVCMRRQRVSLLLRLERGGTNLVGKNRSRYYGGAIALLWRGFVHFCTQVGSQRTSSCGGEVARSSCLVDESSTKAVDGFGLNDLKTAYALSSPWMAGVGTVSVN